MTGPGRTTDTPHMAATLPPEGCNFPTGRAPS